MLIYLFDFKIFIKFGETLPTINSKSFLSQIKDYAYSLDTIWKKLIALEQYNHYSMIPLNYHLLSINNLIEKYNIMGDILRDKGEKR